MAPLNDPKVKFQRYGDISDFKAGIVEQLAEEHPDDAREIKSIIDDVITADLRDRTLKGTRADGRDTKTVRDISISTATRFIVDTIPLLHCCYTIT